MRDVVRPDLYRKKKELELLNRREYSWAEIGRAIGVSRQAAKEIFLSDSVTDNSFMKYGTLGGITAFFRDEGMPVTLDDLFTVTVTDATPPEDG